MPASSSFTYDATIANSSRGDADFTWTLDGTSEEENGKVVSSESGTITYTSSIVPTISGQAWQSDGSIVINPANNNLINTDVTTEMRSISLWFRSTNPTGWQNIYEEGGGTTGWHIALYDDFLTFSMTRSGAGIASIQHQIVVNAVYHVVVVFDLTTTSGTKAILYVNGTNVGSTDIGITALGAHSGDIQFGGQGDGKTILSDNGNKTATNFQGQIQRIDYWSDKAITNSDVSNLYSNGIGAVPTYQGNVMLALEENENGTYTITPRLSRPEVLNENAIIIGLGSSTLNGTGPSNSNNQLRNLFSAYLNDNTTNSVFIERATGGYFTNRFLPNNTNDPDIRPHENTTTMSGVDPDIAIIMLPSNDADDVNGNTAEDFYNNLIKMRDELEKHGVFVFIQDSQPRTQFNNSEQAVLRAGADMVLSDTDIPLEKVIKTFYTLLDEGTTADIDPIYNSGDNIHLTDAAHILMHDEILIPLLLNYFQLSGLQNIELERSLNKDNGYALIDSDISENGETFNRLDDQTYYYRSRIKFLDATYSDYSNVVSITQPQEVIDSDQTIQINFTNNSATTTGWNTWNEISAAIGASITGLLDTDGQSTGISIEVKNQAFNGNDSGITGGVFPNNVMNSSWTIIETIDILPTFEVAGLSNTNSYNVKIICSENRPRDDLYTSAYAVEDDLLDGVYCGNTNDGSEVIRLNGLHPLEGKLNIQFSAPWNGTSYINGMIIERRSSDVITPVELMYFKSHNLDRGIELEWGTAAENNNDYFVLEHSVDGSAYSEIARIEGAGNRNEHMNYSYLHTQPRYGANYYRLTQVDFDGKAETFDSILDFWIKKKTVVYPNPVGNQTRIILGDFFVETNLTVTISELSGKKVWSNHFYSEDASILIETAFLPRGIFTLELRNESAVYQLKLFSD